MVQTSSAWSYKIIIKYITDNKLVWNKDYTIHYMKNFNQAYRKYEFKNNFHEIMINLLLL